MAVVNLDVELNQQFLVSYGVILEANIFQPNFLKKFVDFSIGYFDLNT